MTKGESTPSFAAHVGALDRSVVQTLAVGLRSAELYDPGNAVVERVVTRLLELVNQRTSSGPFVLGVRNRCLFANGRRVRLTAADYPRFLYLMKVFDEWAIQGFVFRAGLSADQLASFLWAVAHNRTGNADALMERLESAELAGIDIIDWEEGDLRLRRRQDDKTITEETPGVGASDRETYGGTWRSPTLRGDTPEQAYLRAVTTAHDATESLRAGGKLGARRARRVTQAIVDQVIRDPISLLALTTIKDYDIYLVSHSINVAILSAMLGQRLGLSKTQLGELTLAAFLHDIGKTELPEEIVNKPGPLTDEEWAQMRRHPELGAHAILAQQHLTPSMMRALRVAYEHHMSYDLRGYPRLEGLDRLSLFARIIMITDRYDAITTPRPYRRRNYTPTEAISHLVAHAGTALDPIVLRFFVEMMGVYPVGTVVRLSTGDVGVVQAPPREGAPANRPVVRLLADDSEVDLGARDEWGHYVSDIVEIMNPANAGQLPAVDPGLLEADEEDT